MKNEPILDAAVKRKFEELDLKNKFETLKVRGDHPHLQLAKPILDVLAKASLAASTVTLLWIFIGSEFESRHKLYLLLGISISTLINYILSEDEIEKKSYRYENWWPKSAVGLEVIHGERFSIGYDSKTNRIYYYQFTI